MKLKKLLKEIPGIEVKGSKDIEITGVCSHSKRVSPGNLFIARPGLKVHGQDYIREAINGGAVAVLTDIFDPFLKQITQVISKDVASLEGMISSEFYCHPSHELWMVGVTGTNGKTTTAYLIKHLLANAKGPHLGLSGIIGTIEYLLGNQSYQAAHTTPDACLNQRMLKEMCLHGCKSCVMEVTSHGLDQKRVSEIDFNIAVFTNLTHEHLDYHGTMDHYAAAKQRLFTSLSKDSFAVINADDPWSEKMVATTQAKIFSYGLLEDADLYADKVELSFNGTRCQLHSKGESCTIHSPLVGRFNLYNLLAAIASGICSGIPLKEAASKIESFNSIPGRLQKIENPLDLPIFVDFAHTPDALKKVLETIKELTEGKVIVVFGCGGDRDPKKRPKMAAIVEEIADIAIVTSDNPRSEDPIAIISQVVEGFKKKGSHIVEVERQRAIAQAIILAKSDDVILIAGKGHETTQIFSHRTIAFDDRMVALQCCQDLYQSACTLT